ncbi:hypothetical protein B0H19DRAFT_1270126 [Mycena capillaripes]|nr:hypothetical protein B0H19DRAFT_1270126 [Mycena capillaripes]
MTELRIRDITLSQIIGNLRRDGVAAVARAETAEAKVNVLDHIILEKDHEIRSLQDQLQKTDDALAIAEHNIIEFKAVEQAASDDRGHDAQNHAPRKGTGRC